jgi:hypothetical protein
MNAKIMAFVVTTAAVVAGLYAYKAITKADPAEFRGRK